MRLLGWTGTRHRPRAYDIELQEHCCPINEGDDLATVAPAAFP
jgi:hypothetical protein